MTDTTFIYTDFTTSTSSATSLYSTSYDPKPLLTVNVGTVVTRLENGCFQNCVTLESISISSTVTRLGLSCFQNCTSLNPIIIPNSVTFLGDSCFEGCSTLASVTIGTGVTILAYGVFNSCVSLTSITIPSVTRIGNYTFASCTGLISITLPDSLTILAYNCFDTCTRLTSITLPSNFTTLENQAFNGCTSLTNFVFTNQKNLTSIQSNTYLGCPAMTVTYLNTPNYSNLSQASKDLQPQFPAGSNFVYFPLPCFKEGSQILTDKGYLPIQDLRKGDLVKTLKHGYLPIDIIGKREMTHFASNERIRTQLYECSASNYPEVFEPLIITGCHSILVDDFVSEEQKEKTIEINGKIYITDNKYRLPACADEKASVYEVPGDYTIYHLALENEHYTGNYGIYANGLLVESCSKRYLKEISNMELLF